MREVMNARFKVLWEGIHELLNLLKEIRESKHSSDKLVVKCIVHEVEAKTTRFTLEHHKKMLAHDFNANESKQYGVLLDQEYSEIVNYTRQLREYLKLDVKQRELSSFPAVKKYYDDMEKKCPKAQNKTKKGLKTIKFFFKKKNPIKLP